MLADPTEYPPSEEEKKILLIVNALEKRELLKPEEERNALSDLENMLISVGNNTPQSFNDRIYISSIQRYLGRRFNNYINQHLLEPEQRHHAILTYLSSVLGLERVVLHDVNIKEGTTEIIYAQGSNGMEEHYRNLVKITRMSFLERLKDYHPQNDKALNDRLKGIKTDLNDKGVISTLISKKESTIINPEDVDMDEGSTRVLFDAYCDDPNRGYVPMLLIPLIGTDNNVFAVLGGSNPFTKRNLYGIKHYTAEPTENIINALEKEKLMLEYSEAKARIERMQEIISIEEGFAHELNNPLTGIGGLARLLSERLPEDHPLRKYADYILEQAGRAEGYVKKRLSEIRGAVETPSEETDLSYLLNDVYGIIEKKHPGYLTSDIKNEAGHVRGDPNNIKKSVLEILETMIETNGNKSLSLVTREEEYCKYQRPYLAECDLVTVGVIQSQVHLPQEDISFLKQFNQRVSGFSKYKGENPLVACLVNAHHSMLVDGVGLRVLQSDSSPLKIELYFPRLN